MTLALSLFLAKIFGIYFFVFGVLMLFRKEHLLSRINALLESPATRFLSAIVTLIIGILLIVSHNIWTDHWILIITLICWLIFLKALLRLFFPQIDRKWMKGFEKNVVYYPTAVITLVLGVLFMHFGYFT